MLIPSGEVVIAGRSRAHFRTEEPEQRHSAAPALLFPKLRLNRIEKAGTVCLDCEPQELLLLRCDPFVIHRQLAEDPSYCDAVVEAADQGAPQGGIGAQIPRTEPAFTDRPEELMIVRGHPAQAGDKREGRIE